MNKKIIGASAVAAIILSAAAISLVNVKFDIILPDGQRFNGIVLSNDNYTQLQNNVGIFTVKNKQILYNGTQTFEAPNMNYCPLAKKIYESHLTTYPKVANDFKSYMLPSWCYPEWAKVVTLTETLNISDEIEKPIVIPEFPYSMMILTVGLIPLIVWRLKKI